METERRGLLHELLHSDELILDTHAGSPSPAVAASVHNVAVSITRFVPSEARTIATLSRVRSLARVGHWSLIAVVRTKVVIYVRNRQVLETTVRRR